MLRLLTIAFVIVLMISFPGCVSETGSRTSAPLDDNATEGADTDSGRATQTAEIQLDIQSLNQGSPTIITFDVDVEVRGYPGLNYRDVQLCTYSGNGTLLGAESIGTINTTNKKLHRSEIMTNMSFVERPDVIFVDHPQLRNDSRFQIDVRQWNHGADRLTLDTTTKSRNLTETVDQVAPNLNFPRTSEVGRCG